MRYTTIRPPFCGRRLDQFANRQRAIRHSRRARCDASFWERSVWGNVVPTGGKRPHRPRPSWRKITPPPVINGPRSDIMNRFLTTTAIGFMLGLAPALAETQLPSNDNAPALEQPATPSEAMPANPADPTANADKASQVPPEVM